MTRINSKGMSGHQQPVRGKSDTWLTPPYILKALGPFDMDPCCPANMPWSTAPTMLTAADDGLTTPWAGRVWLNPPYGPFAEKWLHRMAQHGSGVALIFARTETEAWHKCVWPYATAILFLKGRLHFYDVAGKRAAFNAGAPSALVAYSRFDAEKLRDGEITGKLVTVN